MSPSICLRFERAVSVLLFLIVPVLCWAAPADPPFSGTIFIDPDIITSSDPTTFVSVVYAGQASRTMFDRRVNNWITVNAYLYNAGFNDGLTCEIQVNPEFGSTDAALLEAQKYAPVIGRLPTALRADVRTVWIHMGTEPFGGGNNNLLIHTGQADLYQADGILEETLVHEAAHTSLDAAHANAQGWLTAQTSDGEFISTYARDNPTREDIAESFLPYLAIRYRSDRISAELASAITGAIPNRIAYFDGLGLNMYPVTPPVMSVGREDDAAGPALLQNYPNPFNEHTIFAFDLPHPGAVTLKLYNAAGEIVAVPASGPYPAGRSRVAWDASCVPAGVYVYRLEAAGVILTRRLVLRR